ncbi:MAG: AAA family ATPase [Nitrospirota bacterium]
MAGQRERSIAKISRPRLGAAVLPRPRLFRLVDRTRSQPILWVTGPPGSGKTTLISSYVECKQLKGIWYQLDAGDTDPASLFYYLGLAAKAAAPRFRRPLPLLTPDRLPGLPVFTRRYFEALVARLPTPFVLVFDNYHELPSDSPIHDVVREGLTQIPEGGVVILISRSAPPPSLAAFQASGQMGMLSWDALRLTPSETRALMTLSTGRRFSIDTMQGIQAKTDGWTAGVVLMLQTMKVGSDASTPTRTMSESVFDYFAGEVFAKLARPAQDLLLRSAFLPAMTVRMAEGMAGAHDVGKTLGELARANYFLSERPGSERIYQYHDLFRDFLLSRAKERFSPAELSQVRHRAGTVLESSGRIEDAVDLYAGAGDWAAVQRLILTQAPVLVGQGRSRTLQSWIERLPTTIVQTDPWLVYWQGTCRFFSGSPESLASFQKAFEMFQATGDHTGTLLAWSAAVEMMTLYLTTMAALDPWIEWLDQRVHSDPTFPSVEIEARVMTSAAAALIHRQPSHRGLRRWMDRTLVLSDQVTDHTLRMRIGLNAVNYFVYLGDLRRAKTLIDDVRRLADTPETSPPMAIFLAMWEACYHWLTADLGVCRTFVPFTVVG